MQVKMRGTIVKSKDSCINGNLKKVEFCKTLINYTSALKL